MQSAKANFTEPTQDAPPFSQDRKPKDAAPEKQPAASSPLESLFRVPATDAAPAAGKLEKTVEPAAPPPASVESLKAELKTEINTPVRPQPTREISLKLAGAESGNVELRIIERAGKVHVDVRTPDGDLARSLRADLSELVGRLEKWGFETETWTPENRSLTSVGNTERSDTNADTGSQQSPGEGRQQGQSQQQDGRQRHPHPAEFVQQFETTMTFAEKIKENNVDISN